MRQFEIPYNFDINLINCMQIFDPEGITIACIYIPPFLEDYQTILRGPESAHNLNIMSRFEYEEHIKLINKVYPGKMQLLLQKQDKIMSAELIKYYINLGFNNFCVGTKEQADIIKKLYNNAIIVGSISMKVTLQDLENNNYDNFDYFVLHFPFCKNFDQIKKLPKKYKYILLINAYCNINCDGTHHWNIQYKGEENFCPGLLHSNNLKWSQTTRIRPMDLDLFDPYISIYKLQDRGWPTESIIRDYILYTSDYSIYPNITYNERIYQQK